MSVSGVILYKNEEQFLQRAIDDIYPHVSELVLCNDQSSDRSYEIAAEFCVENNNVLNINITPMLSDLWGFGDKKNFAVSFVKSKWVLLLDADEIIEPGLYKQLDKLTSTDGMEAYAIPRKNYIDDFFQEDAYPDFQYRLFRNYCRYILPVHEQLVGFEGDRFIEIEPTFIQEFEEDGMHIIHKKSSARQETQNDRYARMKIERDFQRKDF